MKELTIEITDKCSLNCLHCSTKAGLNGKIFLSLDDIEGYLERFHDFEVVRLSGGEPFEHPQIVDLCKLVKDYGRISKILSIGVKNRREFDETLMREVKPYLDEIVFSMHGYYNVHDSIVTSDKQWTRQLPYWDMMCDSFDSARAAGIPISFQTVLMKNNYEDLRNMALNMWSFKKCGRENYKWHILRFVKQGRG